MFEVVIDIIVGIDFEIFRADMFEICVWFNFEIVFDIVYDIMVAFICSKCVCENS